LLCCVLCVCRRLLFEILDREDGDLEGLKAEWEIAFRPKDSCLERTEVDFDGEIERVCVLRHTEGSRSQELFDKSCGRARLTPDGLL